MRLQALLVIPRRGRPHRLTHDLGDPWRRVRIGVGLLVGVLAAGTFGYALLGLSPLDAVYQTVITVTTVGYRELGEVGTGYKIFTILLVLFGTGTALYTAGVLIESLFEGRVSEEFRRRRMQQRIDDLKGHVVVCGLGQVGHILVAEVRHEGLVAVAVDRSAESLADVGGFTVVGDATDDDVLRQAGVTRAAKLVLALDHDADNVYVTLSARKLNPSLFIVARANNAAAEPKLLQAGADRVVNPHRIGGSRMAALVTQPHVAEFLDVVMHERELEVRLAEMAIENGSPFSAHTLQACAIRERSGATVLALRRSDRSFESNPRPDTTLHPGDVIIALGTEDQLNALRRLNG
ncbi:MAG: potassium channel protein [Acidimicrobiia bacterium]|nr:potassium channel protein [Acidimicrobiia bacterium]